MNYYKNISNIDMDFVVANLDTKSDYFDEIKANGNKIYNLSKNASKNFFDYIYKIKNFLKKMQINMILYIAMWQMQELSFYIMQKNME